MFVKRFCRTALILLSELALGASVGVAGPVVADLNTKGNPINNLTGNSSAFFLWSNLTGPGVKNPTTNGVTNLQQFSAAGRMVIADPIPASKMLITVGKVTYPNVKGQMNVGQTKVAKPPPPVNGGGNQVAVDSSFDLGEKNQIFRVTSGGNVTTGTDINGKPTAQFSASADRSEGALGSAAAATWDPGQLAPASNGYYLLSYVDSDNMVQDVYMIDGKLGPTDAGETDSMAFLVTDSRVGPSPITNLGDPNSDLWTLTISATGPITSLSNLTVNFQINPLATTAGGGTENILTDSNGVPLSPGVVISRVLGAITIANGIATLAPVDPFPIGTEYHVNQEITYGVADEAGLTATSAPEPSSVCLAGVGVAALLGYVTFRRIVRRPRMSFSP